MLPLEALVDALQKSMRYSDGLVGAPPLLRGGLKHYDSGLVLEKPSDRFHVQMPKFSDFRWSVVSFGWRRLFHRIAWKGKGGGHCYLAPPLRGPCFRRSDCWSLWATYPAARLSPCHRRRNSIMSQPRSVRGMLI